MTGVPRTAGGSGYLAMQASKAIIHMVFSMSRSPYLYALNASLEKKNNSKQVKQSFMLPVSICNERSVISIRL